MRTTIIFITLLGINFLAAGTEESTRATASIQGRVETKELVDLQKMVSKIVKRGESRQETNEEVLPTNSIQADFGFRIL
ncbi:hypothetical protein A2462_03105 [candidate division WOR-1 bacterium RIFOXYC2_FULL_41_25]|uniref:Uncharacterized protein n=1 Tax=candidate division WOR-1 bacterium RIFOXYC2_FULL_41_25 TaxID=1802586 RepID=A0A1F4TPP6_UNCSA|nr:MAG: hypothetical protein A2385_06115 [Bdellovibrionales bacterium RIFOXYB1_FULL_39_21]OFZ41854.1 MAG: hypothetical protein A2485_08085 [Bdellovibrionales bacterium RIFOXYC12_FULL_39_17]OFZ50570.1 MAG: hypothetical protein A2404_05035 [Bdellovibrionales bacterium RIFOXYC1_FULL_39_130]OFZ77793.1 MAG: hypothetical protein A2560_00205 [Bdellovibrionales bacterium RIFOXYD1_FULL_39_84]OFZ93771.1 MAG: hypothetical protein A2504_05710 [Bdellovibrionales bacterium RIFOXYD12_FULL_39_22]OGC34692.1 MA